MLTEEQLQMRKTGIGGSEAAAAIGLSRYETPFDLYQKKLGLSEEKKQNDRMKLGSLWEKDIADLYAEKTGKKLEVVSETIRHPSISFMLANIDRKISGENAILECKMIFRANYSDWGEEGSDIMPTEYLLQCVHYAIVCDVEKVDLAALINGELNIYTYKRNENLEAKLMLGESRLWNDHIEKRIPPPLQSLSDVQKLWREFDDAKFEIADESIEQGFYELLKVKKEITELEDKSKKLEMDIRSYMKDASKLVDASGKKLATLSIVNRKGYFVKDTSYQSFRLTKGV